MSMYAWGVPACKVYDVFNDYIIHYVKGFVHSMQSLSIDESQSNIYLLARIISLSSERFSRKGHIFLDMTCLMTVWIVYFFDDYT